MLRRRLAALAAAVTLLSACTPDEAIHLIFGDNGPGVEDQARAVAMCESTMNPEAVSPRGGNHGLFQINSVHRPAFEAVTGRPWSDRFDALANTIFAEHLWRQQGWVPWSCRP